MIKAIKHLWNVIWDKKNNNFGKTVVESRNVYEVKEFGSRMTFVHRKLKQMFLMPIIMILEWYFKDKLTKSVSDAYQYRKLKVFGKAYDEAILKWNTLYRPYAYNTPVKPRDLMMDGSTQRLLLLKDLYVTVLATDTAYLEFNNFLMDEISKGMSGVEGHHLLYTSQSISDNRYFMISDAIQDGRINLDEVRMKDGKETQ